MRKSLLVVAATAVITAPLLSQTPSQSPARKSSPRPERRLGADTAAQLPVTRVSLYKNGVGFFEHAGRVTGDEAVVIDFTSAQLNDVLQSLTAIDLGGGRISGAGYNSTTPLEQQLKVLPLALGETPTSDDFFNAIRGARVEVRSPGATLAGRLLSFEVRTTPAPTENVPATEKHFLTVASDSGDVRTFELTGATAVRLLDGPLRTDLTRYLELLDANRSQTLRHLTLYDKAPVANHSPRDLRVSYLSEVPIWKSTYRILFTDSPSSSTAAAQTATLQGWSVVDNTTGTDWINVQLSLIAGSPQSFIQPLSQPIYTRRPEIPIAQDAQLTPQTHESGDTLKEDGAPQPAVAGVAGMSGMGSGQGARLGPGSGGNLGGGAFALGGPMNQSTQLQSRGRLVAAASAPLPYETSAIDSVVPNTTTAAFDDYFAYNLTDPVTIRRNESALVPILQTRVASERVTLWNPQQPQALRALWITNSSDLTLDRGSFTIVENGNFGGEGLLDPIHPGERRLLSYAADQAVRVSTDYQHDTRRVQSITVSKGVLKEETAEVAEIEYLVRNAAPEPRTVIVEQPRRPGWQLDSDPKPAETTPSVYRFPVATAARETVRLHIGERHTINQFYRLTDSTEQQLTLLLHNASASPALLAQLEPVFAAKRALASIDTQISTRQTQINSIVEDQKRLRDNLAALKGGPDERTLAKRYTDELNTQEDTLGSLRRDLASLQTQRDAADADLGNKIQSLTVDEKI